jgi:hypothetical protein
VAINSLWLEWQERVTQVGTYSEHLASYEWLKQSLQVVQMLITGSSDAEAQRFISIGQWALAAFQTRFAHLAEEFCKPVAERTYDKNTRPQPTPPDELALRSNLAVPK